MTEPLPQTLRSDAQDNRDRVLDAARILFSERGIGVPMRAIARRAGVGPATLHRRFPTKQQLVDEAFAHELHACAQIVADGCADDDPWRGFCAVVERICVLNASNQGFVDAFLADRADAAVFRAHRHALLRQLTGLARRAVAAGGLRRDFVIDDLVLVIMAGRGLSTTGPEDRVVAARRFAALAIEAFRASETNEPLPPRAKLVPAVLG